MEIKSQNIIFSWLIWHFYEMPKFLFSVWKNYLWFGLYFFSVPNLIITIFSPWRRYSWQYPKMFDIGEFFNTLISNIFSRLIGFVARIFLIIFGIIAQIIIFLVGLSIILLWILIPFILIILLFILYGI